MSFKKYQHLEKLGREEVEGINIGECYIFPKLDGTNASLWYENGTLYCGSRNRILTIDNDNAGFCNYIYNHVLILILLQNLCIFHYSLYCY